MNATTAATTFSMLRYPIPVETLARTDEEFWQASRRLRFKSKKKIERSDTSLRTEEWKKLWSEGVTGSTSSKQTQKEQIREKVEALFRAYADEDFDDGMESKFVNELVSYILKYGNNAVNAISNVIVSGSARPQVIFEALRWLGTLTHTTSYHSRLFLLERSLRSSSRWIRDGAALGLASMKDTRAMPFLREAIDKEKIQDLRKDMEDVLAHLESLS